MKTIKMQELVGDFAENKDIAKQIRLKDLLPALDQDQAITFDFAGVNGATQSFIHALISDAIRKHPDNFYDNVFYKNTADEIQIIITIVYQYLQESLD